jgi:coenzyme F420-reducing hydrogenase alpha subunit
VEALPRVEGEGAMRVVIDGDRLVEVGLDIYEPPRFFEALLRGRAYTEPPDITARICGICPVAYQMSACLALEDACGVAVPEELRRYRRLLYCGEWIESHTLHLYLLHAPDFLGYPDALTMGGEHRDVLVRGLELKRIGNRIVEVVGGRAIHPVNVAVGGFHKLPAADELRSLRSELDGARELAVETVRWAAGFDYPDTTLGWDFVSLQADDEYPIERGRILSSAGLDIAVQEYPEHFVEHQVPHSTAKHAQYRGGGGYVVGPLARWALNSERMTGLAADVAAQVGLEPVVRNPFRSAVVRAVEVLYAVDTAVDLIDAILDAPPGPPRVDVAPRAATGHGATEAPRGLLYHRYVLDEAGLISEADIVPPTSQNQAAIEADLWRVVGANLARDDDDLRALAELTIRNYDPCISCATHFLDLTVERR